MQNGNSNDDFWDLEAFKSKTQKASEQGLRSKCDLPLSDRDHRHFPAHRTSAVEINDTHPVSNAQKLDRAETVITKFVPPNSGASFTKKHIISEYQPQNPLIKSVTIYSERKDEQLFVAENLFIRERRALLDRAATFKEYVPFYSYAPRYSQLNKAQLNYYLWWRQNARNGVFTKTDESYIMLYAYELCATGEGEDKQASLDMLCKLLTSFPVPELNIVYKIMICDMILDFCLIHNLPSPIGKLQGLEKQVLFGSFLPEFFTDLSQTREHCAYAISSMSLYDYRRSKCYNESTADIFKKGIDGALSSVLNNDEAFSSITSFTRGVYGSVSHERHPFNRMTSIVNKNIKIEIVYYSLECIKSAITDIVRYSENKVREHLGIRSRINVLTVNPLARAVIDSFFAENMPAQPFVDRRRKNARDGEKEAHEYDRFYDAPKSEISTERALQIERESWATTKKLTEAFAPGTDEITSSAQPNNTELKSEQQPIEETAPPKKADPPVAENGSLYSQLYSSLGQLAEFVILCKSASALEQRQFASKQSMAVDEIADKINESAVELFGDIILESNGSAYSIIEDYLFLFD